MSFQNSNSKTRSVSGFTFVDVLIGIFLISIIFLSVYGIFRMSMLVIDHNKNKISATAIANGWLERIKNMPYESVGTIGGFPEGILEQTTTTIQNNVQYTIESRIDFVIDDADGTENPEDDCPNDYKRVEIKVSWSGKLSGTAKAGTDIAPKNLSQECAVGGGILSISVFDAYSVMVPSPLIEIKNPVTGENIKTATPDSGIYNFSLPTSTYRVVISKGGCNTERTYGTDEIANPNSALRNPLLIEGKTAERSFSIDKTSNFSIDTLSPWGTENFSDSFLDENKISEKSDLSIAEGEINLATDTEGYVAFGNLKSMEIIPESLTSWDSFTFTDSEPADTDLEYHIYFASGTQWYLIPDEDLDGNLAGFDEFPVDLSGISAGIYPELKLAADFSTESSSTSPVLYDWQISWITQNPTPIPGALIQFYGEKTLGTDGGGAPVYKWSVSTTSDDNGHKEISDLDFDIYHFPTSTGEMLDLVSTTPVSPVNLGPGTTSAITMYLDAQNSLLLTLQNSETLEPVSPASVRLYNNGIGYDSTHYTDPGGQIYFIPLGISSYNLEISLPGYKSTSSAVFISGDETKIIKLEPEE